MKIYVASSWRNKRQPEVVDFLRLHGHTVYDFKHPNDASHRGFHWSDIDPAWKQWTPVQFRKALQHPIAQQGLRSDMRALIDADACVLVMPCGRSAHLEIGFAVGMGKDAAILLEPGTREPELMYGMVDELCVSLEELDEWCAHLALDRSKDAVS